VLAEVVSVREMAEDRRDLQLVDMPEDVISSVLSALPVEQLINISMVRQYLPYK